MHLSAQQLDRAVGAVLASAAGDALGSQYEFGPPMADDVTPEFGIGCFGHAVGEWTDDTSMAMPILQVLADGRTLEDSAALDEIVTRWRDWSKTSKDVGNQTRSVLSHLTEPTAAAALARSESVHRASGRSAGNGSLMRTGPIALGYLDRSPEELAADRRPHRAADALGRRQRRCVARSGASRSGTRSSSESSTCVASSRSFPRRGVNAGPP